MSRPAGRPRRRVVAAATAAALAGLLTSCGAEPAPQQPRLRVTDAFLARPVTTEVAGGFLTVHNDGDRADRLTAVRSDLAARVELHRSTDGRMREVASLPVPAHGALRLSRGGDHLMFLDLRRMPEEGETVRVELRFATSDPITLDVPVRPTHYQPEGATPSAHTPHAPHGEE